MNTDEQNYDLEEKKIEREEQIEKIGKRIQYQINQLKKIDCSVDMSYETIGIFDNEIAPTEEPGDMGARYDYSDQIVYSFDTASDIKRRKNSTK